MGTEDLLKNTVQHGHNFKRIRQRQGMKREAMTISTNLFQQAVSIYETLIPLK